MSSRKLRELFHIPLEHLDFKYIEKSNDSNEVEKILRILRSGEEGHFPQLTKCCEERLGKLNPKSKLLLPVEKLRRQKPKTMDDAAWQDMQEDIQSWVEDVRDVNEDERELQDELPRHVIRQSDGNYSRSSNGVVDSNFQNDANVSTEQAKNLPEKEKSILAARQKDKGNEAYLAKDYDEACMYYSASLDIWPTVSALNNRAQTAIKRKKYSLALSDLNEVLSKDPANTKALLRATSANLALNCFHDAASYLKQLDTSDACNREAQKLRKAIEKHVPDFAFGFEEANDQDAGKPEMDEEEEEESVQVEEVIEDEFVEPQSHTESASCTVTDATATMLPDNVQQMQNLATEYFRQGNYSLAKDKYTCAVQMLQLEESGKVQLHHGGDLAILLSNRAACCMKLGDCRGCILDSSHALQMTPNSVKPLLRRATAYEALEEYKLAYIDFRRVLDLGSNMPTALQGANRCGRVLQEQFGTTWRDQLPHSADYICGLHRQHGASPSPSFSQSSATPPPPPPPPPPSPFFVKMAPPPPSALSPSLLSSSSSCLSEENGESGDDGGDECRKDDGDEGEDDCWKEGGDKSWKDAHDEGTDDVHEKIMDMDGDRVGGEKDGENQENEENGARKYVPPTVEEQFFALKQEGNDFVKKGSFDLALRRYSSCLDLKPTEVAIFTNRALCYLKLGKPDLAERDCCCALEIEADNLKALYRRALARKASGEFQKSLQDLMRVLSLDKNNTIVRNELSAVKTCYKKYLEELKSTVPPPKMEPAKVAKDSRKSEPGNAGAKSAQKRSRKKKRKQQEVKQQKEQHDDTENCNLCKPNRQPIVPTLRKQTPFEFLNAWADLSGCELHSFAMLLGQVPPSQLPTMIGNMLDDNMLLTIIKCAGLELDAEVFVEEKRENERKHHCITAYSMVDEMTRVRRFEMITTFLSAAQKLEVVKVFEKLGDEMKHCFPSDSNSDLLLLRAKYHV